MADDEVAAGVLLRVDTDNTQVITPRASAQVYFAGNAAKANIAYAADIWSSASIDMRTAATKRVTEQRDELNLGGSYAFRNGVSLGLGYRLSAEPDYLSNGAALTLEAPFAQKNSTLALQLSGAHNRIGRAGDNDFQRDQASFGGRLAFTQLLGPETLLQAAYETTVVRGFQASPYRFVGVGGDGLCSGGAQFCLPENHPDQRWRNALAARFRRALGPRHSLAVDYRFYIDDWQLYSNTVAAQWNWLLSERATWTFAYRFYGQGAADFYRQRYQAEDDLRYVTRDRELSRMYTQRLAVTYERVFSAVEPLPPVRLTVALGNVLLSYPEFVGLRRVYAADLLIAAVVEL